MDKFHKELRLVMDLIEEFRGGTEVTALIDVNDEALVNIQLNEDHQELYSTKHYPTYEAALAELWVFLRNTITQH